MRTFIVIAAAVVPIVAGLFSVVVWPAFFRRIAKDPRSRDETGKATTFYKVHRNLIAAAITLGVLSIATGILVAICLAPVSFGE